MRLIFSLVITLFLASCASMPDKIQNTPTGKPEVIINYSNVDDIKASLIADYLIDGYTVTKDTPYLLELQRNTKGNEDFAAYFAVGNAYSSNYRLVSINLIKSDGKVRVVVTNSFKAHMPFGQVNTAEITNNKVFNFWQTYLNGLKKKFENKTLNSESKLIN